MGKPAELFKENRMYTNKDVQNICGVSRIQITHWLQSGVIQPYILVHGRGKVNKFNHLNLLEIMICRELSRFGLPVYIMKDAIKDLRSQFDKSKTFIWPNPEQNQNNSFFIFKLNNLLREIKEHNNGTGCPIHDCFKRKPRHRVGYFGLALCVYKNQRRRW